MQVDSAAVAIDESSEVEESSSSSSSASEIEATLEGQPEEGLAAEAESDLAAFGSEEDSRASELYAANDESESPELKADSETAQVESSGDEPEALQVASMSARGDSSSGRGSRGDNNNLASVEANDPANARTTASNDAVDLDKTAAGAAQADALGASQAVAQASVPGLPEGMTQAEYDKALDYAKLSSQAYDWDDYAAAETGMKLFGGIKDIRDQDFSTPNYQEVGSSGNGIDWWGGRDQGLDYKVFENKDTGDMVVSFRGTEPLSAEDWVEDAEQVLGNSEQYEQAVNMARDLQAQVDQYNADNGTNKQLSFTGHSLGGGLATAASLATGKEAIVFDAAGLSQGTIDANNLDVNHADKVTNFNVVGDFLSDHNGKQDNTTLGSGLAGAVPETKQYGETHWLEGVNDRADFGGWLVSDKLGSAKLAESVLNHAWHVFTYQLENKNFA